MYVHFIVAWGSCIIVLSLNGGGNIILLKAEHTRRQIAATHRGKHISSSEQESIYKKFVTVTDFCRCNKSHKFKLV